MLALEDIIRRLQDRNLQKVASATGLAHTTVWNLAANRRANYNYETVKRLSDYLEANP